MLRKGRRRVEIPAGDIPSFFIVFDILRRAWERNDPADQMLFSFTLDGISLYLRHAPNRVGHSRDGKGNQAFGLRLFMKCACVDSVEHPLSRLLERRRLPIYSYIYIPVTVTKGLGMRSELGCLGWHQATTVSTRVSFLLEYLVFFLSSI